MNFVVCEGFFKVFIKPNLNIVLYSKYYTKSERSLNKG